MNPIAKELENAEIDKDAPFKILIPCVLFICMITCTSVLLDLYVSFLPRWLAFHDFSEAFYHLNSARYSIRRHVMKRKIRPEVANNK